MPPLCRIVSFPPASGREYVTLVMLRTKVHRWAAVPPPPGEEELLESWDRVSEGFQGFSLPRAYARPPVILIIARFPRPPPHRFLHHPLVFLLPSPLLPLCTNPSSVGGGLFFRTAPAATESENTVRRGAPFSLEIRQRGDAYHSPIDFHFRSTKDARDYNLKISHSLIALSTILTPSPHLFVGFI